MLTEIISINIQGASKYVRIISAKIFFMYCYCYLIFSLLVYGKINMCPPYILGSIQHLRQWWWYEWG